DVESASSGSPWDGYGGGILNHGTLTVTGCTLDDNFAHEGGAIFNDGTLTVSGCEIYLNAAYKGGGISNWGTAMFIGSRLYANEASAGSGGCSYNHGTFTLSSCTLIYNLSDVIDGDNDNLLKGSGILNDGTLTVENSSRISDNALGVVG